LVLLALNATFYLPARVGGMKGLYGISRAPMNALQRHAPEDALVIVHASHWSEYARLLPLVEPFGDQDMLIAWSRGAGIDEALTRAYTSRAVYHYYPDEPDRLYRRPRP